MANKDVQKRRRVDWTESEWHKVVANFSPSGHNKREAVMRAQSVLPEERRRKFNDAGVYPVWERLGRLSQKISGKKTTEHHQEAHQAHQPAAAAPSHSHPAPLTQLPAPTGSLDVIFQGLLASAMEKVIAQVRGDLLEDVQQLLSRYQDELMGYWDPEIKKRMNEAKFVGNLSPVPDAPKPRNRTVLVVGCNAAQQGAVQGAFKGVDFTFVVTTDNRVRQGGYYDLAIASKWVSHSDHDHLKRLHGTRYRFVNGGPESIIDAVRVAFNI